MRSSGREVFTGPEPRRAPFSEVVERLTHIPEGSSASESSLAESEDVVITSYPIFYSFMKKWLSTCHCSSRDFHTSDIHTLLHFRHICRYCSFNQQESHSMLVAICNNSSYGHAYALVTTCYASKVMKCKVDICKKKFSRYK